MPSFPLLVLLAASLPATAFAAVHQGNGIKIGEVAADSAVIWTRLTAAPEANWSGTPFIEPSLGGDHEAVRAAKRPAVSRKVSSGRS
jgi:phosphodiesterase/alkaline phosphatase D-like protein